MSTIDLDIGKDRDGDLWRRIRVEGSSSMVAPVIGNNIAYFQLLENPNWQERAISKCSPLASVVLGASVKSLCKA